MNRDDLFKKLFSIGDECIELRALLVGKTPIVEFIPLSTDRETIKKEVDQFSMLHNKERHIFFGVASRDGKGGKKKNVVNISCLWADIDFKNIPEKEYDQKMKVFPFEPTIIIRSGNGFHLYFVLEKSVKQNDGIEIERANEWIATELGGDNVKNFDRILRLPETVNHKYGHKPICEIVDINAKTYELIDFLKKIPKPDKKHTSNTKQYEKGLGGNSELIEQIEYITSQVEEKNVILGDDSYGNWLRIGFALADGLEERGREYFHRVSSKSNKYKPDECNKQYSKCLTENPPEEKITIKTFLYLAKEAGLMTTKSNTIETVSVSKLMTLDFPEPKWMVPSIIPEGLTILSGKPKIGKSILSVNLAVAVATGGLALGKLQVEKSGVLYFALEDTRRRLKSRFGKILKSSKCPENLFVSIDLKPIKDGGLQQLETWLKQNDDIGFVIIDTLGRIKGLSGSTNSYQFDYAEMVKIKKVADSHGIGILLIHHTRKAESEDIYDTVLGTMGITGAADTVIVLEKNKSNISLYVRGRDVEESELALKFNGHAMSFTLIGDASEFSLTGEQKEIVTLLRGNGEAMKLKDIADAIGKKTDNTRHLLKKLIKSGRVFQPRHGEYAISNTK